ncbi:MAG: hypothetical protein ACJ8J7_04285 [Sulfurifustaceae bacterium]
MPKAPDVKAKPVRVDYVVLGRAAYRDSLAFLRDGMPTACAQERRLSGRRFGDYPVNASFARAVVLAIE